MIVEDDPSVTVEMMCQTPLTLLDFFRHLRLELRRRRSRLGDEHLDDRNVDVRKAGDRHRAEADQAENRQDRERHHRWDGAADRPG